MILALAVAVAVAVGLLRGGTVDGLSRISLRGVGVMLLLFVAQSAVRQALPRLGIVEGSWIVWLWCGISVGLIFLCALNWRVPGVPIIAFGIGLNLVVVVMNAAMPVGGPLAAAIDMEPGAASIASRGGFYEAVNSETAATWLGDVIPVPAPPPVRSLVSLGDLLMFVGAGVLVEEGMYRGRYRGRHSVGYRESGSRE